MQQDIDRTVKYPPEKEDILLPLRGRVLRDRLVLRLIAVNRALHFFGFLLLAITILVFSAKRGDLQDNIYTVIADLQGGAVSDNAHKGGLLHKVDWLFSLQTSRLHLFAIVLLVYAAIEGVEAVGLWFAKRWAEYLTLLVTASLIPLEIYELFHHLTPTKLSALIINIVVVVYLLFAKRLFGLRGGVAAEHALYQEEVSWQALEASMPKK